MVTAAIAPAEGDGTVGPQVVRRSGYCNERLKGILLRASCSGTVVHELQSIPASVYS